MKPESQRIAIAEACGWKNCRLIPEQQVGVKPPTIRLKVIVGIQPGDDEFDGERGLPNYLSDLNAMHEAEEVLNVRERRGFAHELTRVCLYENRDLDKPIKFAEEIHDLDEDFFVSHATAAQRAEAFLRTLNLWDNTK